MLRFTGYNFQLPFRYTEQHDEVHLFADTLIHRGVLSDTPFMALGYPPGIFVIDGAAQLIAEKLTGQSFWEASNLAAAIIRLWAALTGVLTALIIALLVRELSNNYTALLAAAIWLSLPNPNFQTVREMPMAWVLLFASLSLFLAVAALQRSRPGLAIASVVAGLLAVTFRYSEAIVLAPAIFASIWHLHQNRHLWLKTLLIQIAVVILYVGGSWVIYIDTYRSGELNHVSTGIANLFNWSVQQPILNAAISQIGLPPLILLIILSLGTILYIHQYGLSKKLISWGFIVSYGFLSAMLVEVYLNSIELTGRYTTPASIPFTIAACIGLTKIAAWLSHSIGTKRIVRGLLVLSVLIWIVPTLAESLQLTANRLRPDTHAALINWAAVNLGQGSILVDTDNDYTFSKIYGGYTGAYRVYIQQALNSRTLTQWQHENVNYAAFAADTVKFWHNIAPEYFSHMLLINKFPPTGSTDNWQSAPLYVFRLWNIQYPQSASFTNSIIFKGFDLSSKAVQSGEPLQIRLYWNAARLPSDNYNVFLHLMSATDPTKIITQADGSPAELNRPTLTWSSPDEVLISPAFQLDIPPSTPAGCYQLVAGLYNYQTGRRLLLLNGQDSMPLTKLCVNVSEF